LHKKPTQSVVVKSPRIILSPPRCVDMPAVQASADHGFASCFPRMVRFAQALQVVGVAHEVHVATWWSYVVYLLSKDHLAY
jgi:hypothetical protein